MQQRSTPGFHIRKARLDEHETLGQLLVEVYASLPGMPQPQEQPAYYAKLRNVSQRAANPAISIFVAVADDGKLLGGVDFISDMKHYGSGGSAGEVADAAGIRLLAVSPDARGLGIGKALALHCVSFPSRQTPRK